MLKKVTSVILAAAMALMVVACGGAGVSASLQPTSAPVNTEEADEKEFVC